MSLAEELLADLEDLDNDDSETEEIKVKEEPNDDEVDSIAPDDDRMEIDESLSSIRSVCKLHGSERLKRVLQQITVYISKPRDPNEVIDSMESDPEYQLIVEVNSIAVEIEHEICMYSVNCCYIWRRRNFIVKFLFLFT